MTLLPTMPHTKVHTIHTRVMTPASPHCERPRDHRVVNEAPTMMPHQSTVLMPKRRPSSPPVKTPSRVANVIRPPFKARYSVSLQPSSSMNRKGNWMSMRPMPAPMPPPIHIITAKSKAHAGAPPLNAERRPEAMSPRLMVFDSAEVDASPVAASHGKRRSPGRSRRKMGTSMMAASTGNCTVNAAWKPDSDRIPPSTIAENMKPKPFEANMKPFARAKSSSGMRSTARASELTSCRVAKTLWIRKKSMMVGRPASRFPTASGSSMVRKMPMVMIIPS